MRSDPGWASDPAHAHDNRWMHRPLMDWDQARRRHDPDSLEGRVFGAIQRLADAVAGVFVPTVLVPLYMILHAAIWVRLHRPALRMA